MRIENKQTTMSFTSGSKPGKDLGKPVKTLNLEACNDSNVDSSVRG